MTKMRILAVDDEADILDLNKMFLERSGELEVQCSTSVREALELLAGSDFDAVVSDYQMPEVDGISFLKTLRGSGNHIPFILFTGKGREDVVIQALNNGADFYLQKGGSATPMYAELEHKLKVAVERRRQHLELQDTRNRFRMVLEKLPIGLWMADKDGRLILGNPAGQRIWGGYPKVGQEEYGVFKAWRLPEKTPIRPDDWALGYAVNEGRETDWELLEIEALDGAHKIIYNWATPLRNDRHEIVGAFVINQEITKEVEMLKALEASERRYRTYVERSPFGLIIADAEGRLIDVNEASCKITGYSKEELQSKSILDLHNEVTAPEARTHFERVVKDGFSSGVIGFVHKSGEIRQWSVEAVRISPEMFMAFVEDVTDRMTMEKSLLVKDRAVECAASGIALLTLDGRFSYINNAVLDILGLSDRSEIIGRSAIEIHADHELPTELITKVWKGEIWRQEVPLRRKDGRNIIVDMTVQLVLDDRGNPLTLMSSIIDITERKLAEDELKETEAKYRELVHNSNDLIYRIDFDPEQRFTYVNPASVRMTGYTPEEHYADPLLGYKMVHPDDLHLLERMMGENRFDAPVQLRWIRKDGSVIWTEMHVAPTYGSDGRLIRVEGVARDVTERRLMESALKSANHKLKLLTSLTRHDISNQLMVMMGSLAMAVQKGCPESCIGRAIDAGKRIDSIIAFTKDYEDLGVKEPRWHRLSDLVGGVFDVHRYGVSFHKDFPDGLEIFADDLIGKVFMNLVMNSLIHGEHVTKIGCWVGNENGDLLIFISDDGIGIPAEDKRTIFERGFGKNSGQGLYLATEILDLTGMSMDEVGEPGKGAVFRIRVPHGSHRMSGDR